MRTFEYLQLVLKHELVAIKELFLELRTTFLAIVIILGGLIFYLKPFPITDITFATSYKGGDWYQEAQSAIEPLKEHWINLNVLATNGAVQNADLLIDPNSNVNAAFTYGAALTHEQRKQIYSLGSVSYNPVWIFYREKATGKISNLHELAKHKIALGPVQSGSYVLAKKLFQINNIPVDNNPNFTSYSFEEAEANFIAGKTDAYIFVTSIYDPSVQKLFREPGIKIMSMLNTSAYERKFSFLDAVTIPAGAIDIDKKIPPEDISLIATTTTLAIRKNLHPALQLALLVTTKELLQDSSQLFFAKRNEFPAYVDTTIPISPVARNFYAHGAPKLASFLPYWLAIFIDRFWLLAISIIAFIYPLTYLNVHLRKFRFIVRERTHYALLLEIESEIANKSLNADEKQRLLHKLDLINKHAISKTIPVGEESAYFLFVNAVQLLRNKLLRSQ